MHVNTSPESFRTQTRFEPVRHATSRNQIIQDTCVSRDYEREHTQTKHKCRDTTPFHMAGSHANRMAEQSCRVPDSTHKTCPQVRKQVALVKRSLPIPCPPKNLTWDEDSPRDFLIQGTTVSRELYLSPAWPLQI